MIAYDDAMQAQPVQLGALDRLMTQLGCGNEPCTDCSLGDARDGSSGIGDLDWRVQGVTNDGVVTLAEVDRGFFSDSPTGKQTSVRLGAGRLAPELGSYIGPSPQALALPVAPPAAAPAAPGGALVGATTGALAAGGAGGQTPAAAAAAQPSALTSLFSALPGLVSAAGATAGQIAKAVTDTRQAVAPSKAPAPTPAQSGAKPYKDPLDSGPSWAWIAVPAGIALAVGAVAVAKSGRKSNPSVRGLKRWLKRWTGL